MALREFDARAVGPGQGGSRTADREANAGGGVPVPRLGGIGAVEPGEACGGGLSGRPEQGQDDRGHGIVSPVTSMMPMTSPVPGWVTGTARGCPRVDVAGEVLGLADLDGRPRLEGETRCRGAHRILGPVGAGDEAHRLGTLAHRPLPFDPEQTSLLIAEGDEEARAGGRFDEVGAPAGMIEWEGMTAAHLGELSVLIGHPGTDAGRVAESIEERVQDSRTVDRTPGTPRRSGLGAARSLWARRTMS